MPNRLIKIGAASELLGVSVETLRKWEQTGELLPDRKSKGGTRFYDSAKLLGLGDADTPTVCYARVSTSEQKSDLERQHSMLETYCAAKGWRSEVIKDMGSGMNYRKKGLQSLLEKILRKDMKRLVITHKDRLLRFGAEWVFTWCELQGIEIVIINKGEQPSFEEELAQDVLEIITVFSARLYGSRSQKHRKILAGLQEETDQVFEQIKKSSQTMLLGFKTELRLNNQQRTLLAKHAGTARHAWNSGLCLCKEVFNHNRNNPDDQIKFPSSIDLHKWLVACIKSSNPWYYESSKCADQQAR